MTDPSIQYKAPFTPAQGYGFEDSGELVPMTMPESQTEEEGPKDEEEKVPQRDTLRRFLEWQITGSVKTAGRKAFVLGYLARLHAAPKTLAELGAVLGVSEGRACQLVGELKEEIWTLLRH